MQKKIKDTLSQFLQGVKSWNKLSLFSALILAIAVGGVFIYTTVFAINPVTPATGGTDISIDTTSDGGSGAWTTMSTNIAIQEATGGDIKLGLYRVNLPSGWEFDVNSIITIASDGLNLVFAPVSGSIVPHSDYFEFRIDGITGDPEKLILQSTTSNLDILQKHIITV